jgi:exopolysaccharide biosynthesis polyprenyl glycosylphosphotransferase
MPRLIAYYLSREMAIVGLFEFALTFTVIHAMLRSSGPAALLSASFATLPGNDIAVPALLAALLGTIGLTVGWYRPTARLDIKRLMAVVGFLAGAAAVVMTLLFSGVMRDSFPVTHAVFIGKVLGLWAIAVMAVRLISGYVIGALPVVRRVAIIGDPSRVAALSARMQTGPGRGFQPVIMPMDDLSWQGLYKNRVSSVVVAAEIPAGMAEPLLDCKMRGVPVLSDAAFHEQHLGRLDLESLTLESLLLSEGFDRGAVATIVSRCADVVIGLGLLMATLPLMLLTAAAIKIDSPGPVFYRQRRIGHFDQPFTLLKFRSMTADAEAGGNPIWAQRQDPRVTRIGRLIRTTRIDELPQLVNVLRGEMSMVGPRPERPHFVEQLARVIPFYRQRAYVKPGLTGWAQVNFPYGASVEDAREKLAYDLYYVKHRTLLLDLIILLSTSRVVLFREGAR